MFNVLLNKFFSIEALMPQILENGLGGDAGHAAWQAWVYAVVRMLLAFFDRMIIWLINSSYQLIMDIADAQIFNETIIELFGNRIYILIAIFMLFKMGITLIRYLADPDSTSDSNTGMGNIIKKAAIALGLLVIVPFLFQEAYRAQSFIVTNQTIGRIILGVPQSPGEENAMLLSYGVYTVFFYPNRDVVGDSCNNVYYISQGLTSECRDALLRNVDEADEDTRLAVEVFDNAIQRQDANALLSSFMVGATTDDNYFLFTYQAIISGIVGFIVALILISFCFDIAIRAVKLGFLQLIAPIPILSSVDPKSELLSKWFTTVVATYLDLFVRLVAIFFSIFVVSIVKDNTFGLTRYSDGSEIDSGWVILFVIVGALLFAKQLPNLIADLMGTKLQGGLELNPLNRVKQVPIAGTAVGAATGVAGGMWGGALAGRASGTSLRGALHGGVVGGWTGAKSIGAQGEAEGAKEHFSAYKAMQAAHKDYTGNEMAVLRSEEIIKGIPIIGKWDQNVIKRRLEEIEEPMREVSQKEKAMTINQAVEQQNLSKMIQDQRKEYAEKRQEIIDRETENMSAQDRTLYENQLRENENQLTLLQENLRNLESPVTTSQLKTDSEKRAHAAKIQVVKDQINNVSGDINNELFNLKQNHATQNKAVYDQIDNIGMQQAQIGKLLQVFKDRKKDINQAGAVDESSNVKYRKALDDVRDLKDKGIL